MVVQAELIKCVPMLNNQQQEALLVIVKSMLNEKKGKMSKLDKLLAQTDRGKPTPELMSLAGSIPTKDMNKIIAAIEDPIWGCTKIDSDGW